MSLLCRRCGTEIEAHTATCGNCGLANPAPPKEPTKSGKALLRIGEALGALLVLAMVVSSIPSLEISEAGRSVVYVVGIGCVVAAVSFTFGKHHIAFRILRVCTVASLLGGIGLLIAAASP